MLTVCLALMIATELILWCWRMNVEEEGLLEDDCHRVDTLKPINKNLWMVATSLNYFLLIELVVFSNRVSAFVLFCGMLLGDVGLFLLALAIATVITASATSMYMGASPSSTPLRK